MMPIKTSQLPTNINRDISLRFLSSSTKVTRSLSPPLSKMQGPRQKTRGKFLARYSWLAFRRVNSSFNVGQINSPLPEFLIRNGKMLF